MLLRVQRIAVIACSFAGAGFFCLLSWIAWQNRSLQIQPLVASWQQAAPAPHAVDPILMNLTRATNSWADSSAAQASSAVKIEHDIRAETWHFDRSLTTLDLQLGRVGPMLDAYASVPPHLNATADQATAAIRDLQGPIGRSTNLLTDLDRSVTDANALLEDQAIYRTADNLAGITGNLDDISRDARKVSDKMAADYLRPVPWWKWPIKRFGEVWDISAAVARHTP